MLLTSGANQPDTLQLAPFVKKAASFFQRGGFKSRFHSCLSLGYAVTGDPAGRLTPMLGGRTSPRRAQSPSSQRGFSLGRAGKRLLFPRHRINCDLNLSLVYHIMRESQAIGKALASRRQRALPHIRLSGVAANTIPVAAVSVWQPESVTHLCAHSAP